MNFSPLFWEHKYLIADIFHIFNRLRQNLGWLGILVSSIPWKISVSTFSESTSFFIADIWDISCRVATKFCMVRGLANEHFSRMQWTSILGSGETMRQHMHQSFADTLVPVPTHCLNMAALPFYLSRFNQIANRIAVLQVEFFIIPVRSFESFRSRFKSWICPSLLSRLLVNFDYKKQFCRSRRCAHT